MASSNRATLNTTNEIKLAIIAFLLLISSSAWSSRAATTVLDLPKVDGEPASPIPDPRLLRMRVPTVYESFALSDDGMLCTFDSDQNLALIYPKVGSASSLEGVLRQPIGGGASAVAFKRVRGGHPIFIISCRADHTIVVIDVRRNNVVAKIPVPNFNITEFAAPTNDTARFAYYTDGMQARVGRVNLASMRDEGVVQLPPGSSNPVDIATSPDGTLLYTRQRDLYRGEASVFQVSRDSRLQATLIRKTANLCWHFAVSPDAQFVATGTQVLSPKLDAIGVPAAPTDDSNVAPGAAPTIEPMPGTESRRVLAFSEKTPFMFGTDDEGNTVVWSTNTNSPVATTQPLIASSPTTNPAEKIRKRSRAAAPAPLAMFFDDQHQVLIAVDGVHVGITSMADLHVESEPIARVEVHADPTVAANHMWDATLHKVDPSIQVELIDPPAGMTLQSDVIRWTPTSQDRGPHTISLSISAGKITRTQQVVVNVTRGGLRLPFPPDVIALSPDGKRAAIALTAMSEPGSRFTTPDENAQSSGIAVIDLANQVVVCQRTLLTPLQTVAIDNQNVYIAKRGSAAIGVLSCSDLTDKQRVFTDGVVTGFQTTGNRLYVVEQGKPMLWLKVPELVPGLDPMPASGVDAAVLHDLQSRLSGTPPSRVDGGWYDNGVIFNEDFTRATQLIHDEFFLTAGNPRSAASYYGGSPPPVGPWHTKIQSGTILREGGQAVGQMPTMLGQKSAILPDRPLAAGLVQFEQFNRSPHDPSPPTMRAQINLFELATGDRLDPIILNDIPITPGINRPSDQLQFAVGPNVMVATINSEMFIVASSETSQAPLMIPMAITPPDGMILLPGDHASTIPLHIESGKRPIRFELSEDLPGVEIDGSTGVVKIDPRPLYKDTIAALDSLELQHSPGISGPELRLTIGQLVDGYQHLTAQRVKELTGKPSTGIPVELMLTVIARDSEQQTVRSAISFLIDMPAADIRAKLNLRPLPTPRVAPTPKQPPAIPPDTGGNTKPV